jgi:hypothetical protein
MNLCEYIYYTSQAILSWVSRGRDCMIDEFTTTYAIRAYHI